MPWTPARKRAARRGASEAKAITGGVCTFCGHAGRVQQARRWDERPVGEACSLCARAVYLMGWSRVWAERFDWSAVLKRISAAGTDPPTDGSGPYIPVRDTCGPGPLTASIVADIAEARARVAADPTDAQSVQILHELVQIQQQQDRGA